MFSNFVLIKLPPVTDLGYARSSALGEQDRVLCRGGDRA